MQDNHIQQCPLCGKETVDQETFCRDCQEIADNSYAENLLAHNLDEETKNDNLADSENTIPQIEIETETISERKTRRTPIIVSILLLLFTMSIGTYFYLKDKNAKELETNFWEECIKTNTPDKYSGYLLLYPDGRFAKEAQEKIRTLRDEEKTEWEKLRTSSDIDALFAFLTDHPNTPYKEDIRRTTDSLSWIRTTKDNSADAYLAYLENVKLGRFRGDYQAEAQQKYDYLSQLITLEGDSLISIRKDIERLFRSISETSLKDFQKETTTKLNYFFSSSNKTPQEIIDSLKSDYKKNKIKSVVYIPLVDSMEVILDNKGVYFITVPVRADKTFADRKKKKESKEYTLGIKKNEKNKIETILQKSR